jgi:hypothetical protein
MHQDFVDLHCLAVIQQTRIDSVDRVTLRLFRIDSASSRCRDTRRGKSRRENRTSRRIGFTPGWSINIKRQPRRKSPNERKRTFHKRERPSGGSIIPESREWHIDALIKLLRDYVAMLVLQNESMVQRNFQEVIECTSCFNRRNTTPASRSHMMLLTWLRLSTYRQIRRHHKWSTSA